MYCSNCGKQINENNKFCENCGNQVNEKMFNTEDKNIFTEQTKKNYVLVRTCGSCGNKISDIDTVCHHCGAPVNEENTKFDYTNEEIEEENTDEIINNIETIKKAADIVKTLFIILAVLCFFASFVSLVNLADGNEYFIIPFLVFGIAGAIILVISRFIEAFIKWKAYMLQTNYGILKNTEHTKNEINKL